METKAYLETAGRSVLGAVPTIGTALNEIVFEHRSRLKQRRFEEFVDGIAKQLEFAKETAINHDYLHSDEFIDFFESVLYRVTRNNSLEKLERLKKLFVSQIQEPIETDFQETFLDLVMGVSEMQLLILKTHMKDKNVLSQDDLLEKINQKGNTTSGESSSGFRLARFRLSEYYGIPNSDYRYLVQDLIAKCLMIDDSMGRMGIRPLQKLEITELGEGFIHFVQEAGDN